MVSFFRMNSMESLCVSMQMEIATGVNSNKVTLMATAHIIRQPAVRLTQGSAKIITKVAMVFIHGLMEDLTAASIKIIKEMDMDFLSTRMATSMTASGQMTTKQARLSTSMKKQVSFKESYGKMMRLSKL